jgi:hypothetical protein
MSGPGSGGPIYFAWVDKNETDFDEETHCRYDEPVWSIDITHDEGQIPTVEIEITNPCIGAPYVGLLAASRKQWAWVAVWDDDSSSVKPLIFGRIVGIPSDLSSKYIKILLVARADDYLVRKQTLADSLKVAPSYDPIFFDDKSRNDPDSILEGYSAAWHIDRTTLAWTISDILEAEDGDIPIGPDEILSDLSVTVKGPPLRAVRADATVQWSQNFRGVVIPVETGVVNTLTGSNLISQWPKPGDDLGGGWKAAFGTGAIDMLGTEHAVAHEESGSFQDTNTKHNEGDVISMSWNSTTPPPGITVGYTTSSNYANIGSLGGDTGQGFGTGIVSGQQQGTGDAGDDTSFGSQSQWQSIQIWKVATSLYIMPDGAPNPFTELLTLTLTADVQPVLTDETSGADTEVIELNSIDVGEAYVDIKAWSSLVAAGGSVQRGQVMQPNIPVGPGGLSPQVALNNGTMGASAPAFSDIAGETTGDGSVVWASFGSNVPTIGDWSGSTFVRKGTIICYETGGGWFFLCTTDGWTGTRSPFYLYDIFGDPVTDMFGNGVRDPNIATPGHTFGDGAVTWTALGSGEPSLIVPIGGQPGNIQQADFYSATRGQNAIEFIISKCVARMKDRSRAVEIGCEIPFSAALDLSLRKSATITHKYLPGGVATGKIIGYSISADGEGKRAATIKIGCAVGRGGSVTASAGTDDWSDAIDHDAQTQTGGTVSLGPVTYAPPPPTMTYNGLKPPLDRGQVVLLAGWFGSLSNQSRAAQLSYAQQGSAPNKIGWGANVFNAANRARAARAAAMADLSRAENSVYFECHLRPISGNSVTTPYYVAVSDLKIPKQIDLEAEPA